MTTRIASAPKNMGCRKVRFSFEGAESGAVVLMKCTLKCETTPHTGVPKQRSAKISGRTTQAYELQDARLQLDGKAVSGPIVRMAEEQFERRSPTLAKRNLIRQRPNSWNPAQREKSREDHHVIGTRPIHLQMHQMPNARLR